MSSPVGLGRLYSSKTDALIRGVARPLVLSAQRRFGLFPREVCLVSGAPRSGTTALCHWLSQQTDVSAFTESRILVSTHKFMEESYRFHNLAKDSGTIVNLARHLVTDYYSSSRILIGKKVLIDKEPLEPIAFPSREYGRFITNVRTLFPNSKLLLIVRDPIAAIWSMTRRSWGSSLTNAETRRFTLEEHIENWSSCAELIMHHCADPNAYIVQYGRLIHDAENESKRIFAFLDLREGKAFRPRRTKEIGFSDEERRTVLRMVHPRLEALSSQGISELS